MIHGPFQTSVLAGDSPVTLVAAATGRSRRLQEVEIGIAVAQAPATVSFTDEDANVCYGPIVLTADAPVFVRKGINAPFSLGRAAATRGQVGHGLVIVTDKDLAHVRYAYSDPGRREYTAIP